MAPQRVILTTFAGRRDRMALLAAYAAEALRRGTLTEYHVWDYARTAGDRAWIATLPSLHPAIRVFATQGARYDAYYDHYREEEYGDAVFVKADDDIVHLDLEGLPAFLARRLADEESFLLSANVVNNGVCAFFQQQQGAVPRSVMELPYPPAGFCGELWKSAELATRLHRHFLADPAAFARPGTTVAPDRLSINFVSYRGRDLRHFNGVRGDDEQALSVTIPRRLGRTTLIDNAFVVAHLSFFSQEPRLDAAALIGEYRALLRRVLARREPPPEPREIAWRHRETPL